MTMIEINLAPTEIRKKKKKSFLPGGFNIPLEVVVGSAGGLLMLLVLLHIGLLVLNITKLNQHKGLEKQMAAIAPGKQKADEVITDLRKLKSKLSAVEKVIGEGGIVWAEKLNIVSDVLPRGVWIRKIALTDEMLFIEGSAISRERKEMINVHKFTSNLKEHENFLSDLYDLELGSIQSRLVDKTEVADFLITLKLENVTEE